MPKRRKKRIRIRWSRLLALLLTLNIVAGLAFSPITSAARVRVVGMADNDQPRVYRALQRLRDVPSARVSVPGMESLILTNPAIKSVKLTHNIFRQAVLEVEYLKAAASITGQPKLALSTDGNIYLTHENLDGLAEIRLPALSSSPVLSICAGWECQTLAEIAKKINRDKALQNMAIEVYSKGLVCLNNRQGARVILGPTERLDEKFDKLQELLQEQPDLLLRAKEINLVSPSKPVARFFDQTQNRDTGGSSSP